MLRLSIAFFKGANFFKAILSRTIQTLGHSLKLSFQALDLVLRVEAQGLMGLHNLFDLSLILRFHSLHDCILVALRLLLIVIATLLKLFKSYFKLALGLEQVSLIVVLLSLKEHNFAFPKSLIAVIVALKILELSLCLLQLGLHLCQIFCLH